MFPKKYNSFSLSNKSIKMKKITFFQFSFFKRPCLKTFPPSSSVLLTDRSGRTKKPSGGGGKSDDDDDGVRNRPIDREESSLSSVGRSVGGR